MSTLIGVEHDSVLEQANVLLSFSYGDVLCGEECYELVIERRLCPNQGANVSIH